MRRAKFRALTPDEYLAATSKSMSREQAREFEAQVRSVYGQMARISIEPVWARYYDFAAGRIPEFLRQLTEESQEGNGGAGG